MSVMYLAWAGALLVLCLLAAQVGRIAQHRWSGILIDHRGRYSLTNLQVVLWTLLVLSLISGLFVARVIAGVPDALGFAIPTELLGAMGIALGGGALATAMNVTKDIDHPDQVAASNEDDPPRFSQIFLLDEGSLADQVVDVYKFQNFWLTIILVSAYAVLAIAAINGAGSVAAITLPGFDSRLLVLLGASHVGHLAGNLPSPAGTPDGLSVALRDGNAQPVATAPTPPPATTAAPATYAPRNPA